MNNDSIKIYKDKSLKEEILSTFHLGIVPAGETRSFTFWVSNESNAYLKELKFSVEHQEVEVTEAPTEMLSHTVEKLVLTWNPSITLKEGLEAQLKVSGIELWGRI